MESSPNDIYNSQIEIIFYYCDYLMDERQSVLREYVSNIYKLFTNYSENSKFTTKNLLHKLNLEGRITINLSKKCYRFKFHNINFKTRLWNKNKFRFIWNS